MLLAENGFKTWGDAGNYGAKPLQQLSNTMFSRHKNISTTRWKAVRANDSFRKDKMEKSEHKWAVEEKFTTYECQSYAWACWMQLNVLSGRTLWRACIPVKRKTKKLYLRALNELKEINPCLKLCLIKIDIQDALVRFRSLSQKIPLKMNCFLFRWQNASPEIFQYETQSFRSFFLSLF